MMSTIINFAASTGQLPKPKLADKLIVLVEMPDERRAVAAARMLSLSHAGVITWVREANLALGEYGPAEVLYQAGDVPDLD